VRRVFPYTAEPIVEPVTPHYLSQPPAGHFGHFGHQIGKLFYNRSIGNFPKPLSCLSKVSTQRRPQRDSNPLARKRKGPK
jgi:hypothetical protein